MKEEDRLFINENVDDTLQKLELIEEKKSLIKELEQDAKVKEYLNLQRAVYEISKLLDISPSDFWDKIVFELFEREYIKERNSGKVSCEHVLWIYLGAYYSYLDFESHSAKECKCDSDSDKYDGIRYHKYQCIECNKIENASDYQKFEQEHVVLKTKEDFEYYQLEYFRLLMNNTTEETQKILVNKYGVKK